MSKIILVTELGGIRRYIRSTSVRWDNKRLANLTADLEKAKTFDTEKEANELKSKLFTYRHFFTEPKQTPRP